MKILVINGSPRGEKSNTLKLTNAFLDGYKSAKDCEIEVVALKEKKIEPCLGCFGCWTGSPGKCVIKDDVRDISIKMFASDLVIYSFPLFYYSLPAKLKAFVERQLPTVASFMTGQKNYLINGGHPPRFEMKFKTLLISNCGFYPIAKSYDAVRAQFNMICGDDGYDDIFIGEGELFCKAIAKRRCDARLEELRNAGVEYAKTGKLSEDTKAKLTANIFPPDMYAAMADEGWGNTIEDYRKNDEEFIAAVKKEGKTIKTIY